MILRLEDDASTKPIWGNYTRRGGVFSSRCIPTIWRCMDPAFVKRRQTSTGVVPYPICSIAFSCSGLIVPFDVVQNLFIVSLIEHFVIAQEHCIKPAHAEVIALRDSLLSNFCHTQACILRRVRRAGQKLAPTRT